MDYFKIKEDNIILHGSTHEPYGRHEFIVYINPKDKSIHVNTEYCKLENDIYKCCVYYDRKLCNTIIESRQLTVEIIEKQAYNSWMDGAR